MALLATLLAPYLHPSEGQGLSDVLAAEVAPNDSLGIAHISYGNGTFSPARYQFAREAGVGWDRWVFYWNEIERTPGRFDYSRQDGTLAADRAQGLEVLGVLMGTPAWAGPPAGARVSGLPAPQVGQRGYPEHLRLQAERLSAVSETTLPPQGLDLPVFSDGTDVPGPGKSINPANLWARFVYLTSLRYRGKVRAWEIWNEPDYAPTAATGFFGFWSGGLESYARLLKVAYLAIRVGDPSATVVMGGMAFWFQQDFFPRLLAQLRRDPQAPAYGYYFDATAWHWYSRASLLMDQTQWARQQLARAGITGKAVWITETNLPVCGDRAVREVVDCAPGSHRGTLEDQASFIVQALAYAKAAGVERVFVFQLFDDNVGPGEYFGLVRNDGTARPALRALQLAAAQFRGVSQGYRTTSLGGRVELVTLRTEAGQRIRVVWSQHGEPVSVGLPVEGVSPLLVDMSATVRDVSSSTLSLLRLSLAPASLNDSPRGPPDYIVGGKPLLLLEYGVSRQGGRLEGVVRDASGKPVRGMGVWIGNTMVATDTQGRYGLDVSPGLYDVEMNLPSHLPPQADPILGVAVWAGRSTARDFYLRPLFQRFLPVSPHRLRQG
ncbi:MAG: hypothetical protein HYY02_00220 [Chloroflexi bacterium]|nr:hypothetical protein [Chloroflexota bacterium]